MEFNSIIIIIPITNISGILANATNYVSLRPGQSLVPPQSSNQYESLRTPNIFHASVPLHLMQFCRQSRNKLHHHLHDAPLPSPTRPCLFDLLDDIELNILRIVDAFKEQLSPGSCLPLPVGEVSPLAPFAFHVLDRFTAPLPYRGRTGSFSWSGLPLDTLRTVLSWLLTIFLLPLSAVRIVPVVDTVGNPPVLRLTQLERLYKPGRRLKCLIMDPGLRKMSPVPKVMPG